MTEYEIRTEPRESTPVISVRMRTDLSRIGQDLGTIFPKVFQYVTGNGGEIAGPPFARYHFMDETEMDMEAGIPVASGENLTGEDDVQLSSLPGGHVATTWHVGPFEQVGGAYFAIEQWMKENGKTSAGAPWEVYWTDPEEEPDPNNYRTEIVWPISGD